MSPLYPIEIFDLPILRRIYCFDALFLLHSILPERNTFFNKEEITMVDIDSFSIIDCETLMGKAYTPIRFIIENLFAPGLHILAGAQGGEVMDGALVLSAGRKGRAGLGDACGARLRALPCAGGQRKPSAKPPDHFGRRRPGKPFLFHAGAAAWERLGTGIGTFLNGTQGRRPHRG